MAQNLPLNGVKVVDYSHFLAGPFLSRALAALGAEVTKVERPKEGDAGRAHARAICRSLKAPVAALPALFPRPLGRRRRLDRDGGPLHVEPLLHAGNARQAEEHLV